MCLRYVANFARQIDADAHWDDDSANTGREGDVMWGVTKTFSNAYITFVALVYVYIYFV